ncbi:MAG: class II aldolase/adducin family protein [Candidatus Promineifilaceae bacterium]|nr:class II aldolase/adducin family protein [Candidatus Promineifilaceae bacterium]
MTRLDERELRHEIVRIGRLLYEKDYIVGSEGNISARLAPGRILITPSGLHKAFLEPAQLLVVDEDGQRVGPITSASRHLKPTSELPMHLEVYRQRPDVAAVVHAHPPTTITLSIAGIPLADCMLPEVIVLLGLIPTTAYATPSSEENVAAIRHLIGRHDALCLQRHGSLTVGDDPLQAFIRLEIVEKNAQIAFRLAQLGIHNPLPEEEVRKLLKMREEMGLSRPGEAAEFCAVCGVCHPGDEHQPLLRPGVGTDGQVRSQRQLSAGPQALPPIRPLTVDESEIRRQVAQLVRKTLGEA